MSATIDRLRTPGIGDDGVAYDLAIRLRHRDVDVRVAIDVQVVLVGRAALTFFFEGATESPMLDHQDVVQKAVARSLLVAAAAS